MRIWLTKPIYETLPYFYLLAGIGCMVASIYLDYWYWPALCLIAGSACFIYGLVVLLRRRDFRRDDKPSIK